MNIIKKYLPIFALLALYSVYLLLFLLLSGCSINRQMQKQTVETREESKTEETAKTVAEATTNIDLTVQSTTRITEAIDTIVTVPIAPTGDARLDEFLKNNPLKVPVRIHRTIERQDFTRRNEQKKEATTTEQNKQAIATKETESTDKKVVLKTKNYIGVLLISGGFILVVLLFVFLWKRIPLKDLFDGDRRKSPG